MSLIEPLESRIAPAAGLTLTQGPGGSLAVDATGGDDRIELRSDEPGWLTAIVYFDAGGEAPTIAVDGVIKSNPYTMPMPKGAITVNMLGGEDVLYLGPATIPGSVIVNDLTSSAGTGGGVVISGLTVKGALTINGSSGDDIITVDGKLSVGKDFNVNFGGGTFDGMANSYSGLTVKIGGSFRVQGTADATAVTLGLDISGNPVRANADPGDDPLTMRELRVGKDFTFTSPNGRLFLGSALTQIGGKLDARATGASGSIDFFSRAGNTQGIIGGLNVQAADRTNVYVDALALKIGKGISVTGGTGNDSFTLFGRDTMSLPKTNLIFGDGNSTVFVQAHEAWTLSGSLALTAGNGDDSFTIAGPGKITGGVTGDFGVGHSFVAMTGEQSGRLSFGPLVKFAAQSQMVVRIYNANLAGKVEVTGSDGADALFFDSVKVAGSVAFTSGLGSDLFSVDGRLSAETSAPVYLPLFVTPSVFSGPINVDLGGDTDYMEIGTNTFTGRASFLSLVSIRGVAGENTFVAGQQSVTFKKQPTILQ